MQTVRVCVMTGRPDLVRHIIAAPIDQYDSREEPGTARVFGKRAFTLLSGSPLWRERRLVVPHFQGEALNALGGMIRDATLEAFGNVQRGETFVVRGRALDVPRPSDA